MECPAVATRDQGGWRDVEYRAGQKVLLVGDGNLSFARAMCTRIGTGVDVVATTYDSETELLDKYPETKNILATLTTELKARVLHGVDAEDLQSSLAAAAAAANATAKEAGSQVAQHSASAEPESATRLGGFDRIVFQFPLAVPSTSAEEHARRPDPVVMNKMLIMRFLRTAAPMLAAHGAIHVASKEVKPYTWWRIPRLSDSVNGVRYLGAVDFDPTLYPGYQTRKPINVHFTRVESFPFTDCRVFVFDCGEPSAAERLRRSAPFFCQVCDRDAVNAGNLAEHYNGKKHKLWERIEARWAAALLKSGTDAGGGGGGSALGDSGSNSDRDSATVTQETAAAQEEGQTSKRSRTE